MNVFSRHSRHCLLLLVLPSLLLGCATKPPAETPAPPVQDDTFITPAGLEPQVEFWVKVYSHWSQGQVALHDNRHMDLVYRVLELPGPVSDGYSKDSRRYVREQQRWLKQQLNELEQNHSQGLPLSPQQQALAEQITAVAGEQAIWGAAERLRSQRGLRERFQRGLAISTRYVPLFQQIFRNAGLPADLAYLPHVESSFQAHARSSVGATGMWQFTKGAARTFMTDHPGVDERLDPVASAKGAARYLATAHRYLDSWPLALTSYNHGIGSMRKARERFGTDFMQIVRYYDRPSFGFASRNFYAEFLAARAIARSPETYFPTGVDSMPQLELDSIVLADSIGSDQLARYFAVPKPDLVELNPAWTAAAVHGKVALPPGLTVWLPRGAVERRDDINRRLVAEGQLQSSATDGLIE